MLLPEKPTYQVYSYNDKYRIVPSRLALKRDTLGWTQHEFINKLNDYAQLQTPIKLNVCSLWETGRRPVPSKYNIPIAKLFGVSVAYMVGLTTDETKEEADDPEQSENTTFLDNLEEISVRDLDRFGYDGIPVYVEFVHFQHQNGWGLYSSDEHKIFMLNRQIDPTTTDNIRVFIYKNEAPRLVYNTTYAMKYSDMMREKTIYVEMLTKDKLVHATYDGIYRHNEDHSMLINAKGFTLPYDGINESYIAFPTRSAQKRIIKETRPE